MIPEVSILLVASLLGSVSADQFSEVYNKDDTFLKFRDASDFQPPPPDLRNVPIEGLPSYQQGYQLVNTQEVQRAQTLTDSQRETVRKQEDFLKSVLESNKARSNQPVSTSNEFSGFQQQQQPATLSPTTHTFRKLDTPAADFTSRPTFNLRTQGEPKVTPSTLHTIEFNSFQTEPASVNQVSGSVIQHVPVQKNVHPERRPTFAFREQSTTPSYHQDVTGFLHQDSARTNVHAQPQQQLQPQLLQQPIVQHQTDVSSPHGTFNVNRRPIITENQQRFDEVRISGSEQSIVRPELDNLQRLPKPETTAPFDFRSGEDEEARFISQVNQNTAAGASQISSFQQTPQLNDFNALPAAPAHSIRRPFSQNLPQQDAFDVSKKSKSVAQRTRKPVASMIDPNQFGFVPTSVAPLRDVSRQRPSTRLQNENLTKPEELIDELEARKQAESAQYNFASSVMDTVNGNSQSRQEVRDGLKLTGMYSYSDGFFKRTVFYEADENGYRIVKEETEPIGKGPEYNPNGEVQVNYQHAGSRLNYKIRGDQFKKRPVNKKPALISSSVDYDDQLELPS